MTKEEAMAALKEVAYAIRSIEPGQFNIRRGQQGDPEFCIEVGGYQGAQLNKHHLRAMLVLIAAAEEDEEPGKAENEAIAFLLGEHGPGFVNTTNGRPDIGHYDTPHGKMPHIPVDGSINAEHAKALLVLLERP